MSNDENSFLEALNQHDFEVPEVGDIKKGIIVALTQQGVIVDLGLKRDGIVPANDFNKLEEKDKAALKVNDEVDVYVVDTEAPDSLIVSIHMAQLNQDWIDAEAFMKSGEIFEGEVIGYNKGGAIVPFGHLRGFIPASHLTELTRGMNDRQRQQKLAKLRGTNMPLKIIEVDRRRRRLVFSQRDAQKEWDSKKRAELLKTISVGDKLSGTISGLRDFGVFVDLGGADGLVHISELAWHRISHPKEVVKVGDVIDVEVLKVDPVDQRISLSRKTLLPNPWSLVHDNYEIDQLVEGTITRIVDYGAFAEIEPGVEGLLHVSQLSRAPVEKVGDVVAVNERHLLRIISIDSSKQRIGLSLKAVKAHEQIEWMAQHGDLSDDSDSSEEAVEEAPEAETSVEATPEEPATESKPEASEDVSDDSSQAESAEDDSPAEDDATEEQSSEE
ncbi:MAG: S1 RNA-binding domain-containing protein [Chloroflexota bacterium]